MKFLRDKYTKIGGDQGSTTGALVENFRARSYSPSAARTDEKQAVDEIEEARKMLPGIPAGVFSSVNEFTTPL